MIRDLRKFFREGRRFFREARRFLKAKRRAIPRGEHASPASTGGDFDKALEQLGKTQNVYEKWLEDYVQKPQRRKPIVITGGTYQWPAEGLKFERHPAGDLLKPPVGEVGELLLDGNGIALQIELSGGRIVPLGAVTWEEKKDEPKAAAQPEPVPLNGASEPKDEPVPAASEEAPCAVG